MIQPNPVEHAAFILEACCGHKSEAKEIVALNAHSDPERVEYWLQVFQALSGASEC